MGPFAFTTLGKEDPFTRLFFVLFHPDYVSEPPAKVNHLRKTLERLTSFESGILATEKLLELEIIAQVVSDSFQPAMSFFIKKKKKNTKKTKPHYLYLETVSILHRGPRSQMTG